MMLFCVCAGMIGVSGQEEGASLQGIVTDRNGDGVAAATVILLGENEGRERRVLADEDGRFRYDRIENGVYVLTVQSEGFAAVSQRIDLKTAARQNIEIQLDASGISENVTVTATRSVTEISTIPGAVSVITRDELANQSQTGIGIADALSKTVPGLSPSNQSLSVYGQTLRGRPFQVLIDGIPQSTTRNAFRDLQTIDFSSIDRVEVVRGTTAIYGDGATGGIINLITRPPADERLRFTTDVGTTFSATHPSGSLGGYLRQNVSGRRGRFDFVLGGGLEKSGAFFDADGSRIPPDPNGQGGLADAVNYNLLGKVGFALSKHQRLAFAANLYRNRQNTSYTSDPSVGSLPPRTRSRTVCCVDLDNQQGTDNTVVSLDYLNTQLFDTGTSIHAQAYYRDFYTRFFPYDGRPYAAFGNSVIQTYVDSIKRGGRLEFSTPLARNKLSLLYGADLSSEGTAQPASVLDPVLFASSGGRTFRTIGERTFTPYIAQRNLGVFLQIEYRPVERGTIRAGVRREKVGMDVPGYTTISGGSVAGGDLDYGATLFNAGATYNITDTINAFANFSQGFSVADVGRTLRGAASGFTVTGLRPEALKVDNYETGLRYAGGRIQSSLSLFYNTSELGTSFTPQLEILRAPEKVYGAEAEFYFQPATRARFGASVTWLEGKSDPNLDGVYTYLAGDRIPPLKATAFTEYSITPRLTARLQMLYSGERQRFGDVFVFGLSRIDDYAVFDLLASYRLKNGTLRVGVENLFNKLYYPPTSQFYGSNASFSAARGMQLSIGYSISY